MPRDGRDPSNPLYDSHRGNRLRFARELSEASAMTEKLASDYEKLFEKMFPGFPIVERGEDLHGNLLSIVHKFKDLSKRLGELGHLVQSFAPIIEQFKTRVPRAATDLENTGERIVAMDEWLIEGDPVPDALLSCKEKHLLTWRQPHLAQPLVNCKTMLAQRAEFLRWQDDCSISRHMHGVWTGRKD